jgi:hypothetical protein
MSQRRPPASFAILLLFLSTTACVREMSLPTDAAPASAPTPSAPKVEPTPAIATPAPSPSATPVATSCPTLLGIRVTVFATQPSKDRVVLDATPLTEQCAAFPGRLVCPLGRAGSEQRSQCEAARIGAEGPVWSIEPYGWGTVEALEGSGSGYLAAVVGRGRVTACSRVQPDMCTSIEIR